MYNWKNLGRITPSDAALHLWDSAPLPNIREFKTVKDNASFKSVIRWAHSLWQSQDPPAETWYSADQSYHIYNWWINLPSAMWPMLCPGWCVQCCHWTSRCHTVIISLWWNYSKHKEKQTQTKGSGYKLQHRFLMLGKRFHYESCQTLWKGTMGSSGISTLGDVQNSTKQGPEQP